jgi:hypothetical protein
MKWHKLTFKERIRLCWRIFSTGIDTRYNTALDIIEELQGELNNFDKPFSEQELSDMKIPDWIKNRPRGAAEEGDGLYEECDFEEIDPKLARKAWLKAYNESLLNDMNKKTTGEQENKK